MAGAHVVGNVFAVGDDDLVVLLIDPDAALKVALFLLDGFGLDVEDPGVDVVDLLLTDVSDVVLRGVLGGEHEGQALLDVFEVGRGHHDAGERVGRRFEDALGAVAVCVKGDVDDLVVAAIGLSVVVDGFDADAAGPGVVVESMAEDGFFRGELGDDLLDRDVGLRLIEGAEPLVEGHGGVGSLSAEGWHAEQHGGCESKGGQKSGLRGEGHDTAPVPSE